MFFLIFSTVVYQYISNIFHSGVRIVIFIARGQHLFYSDALIFSLLAQRST